MCTWKKRRNRGEKSMERLCLQSFLSMVERIRTLNVPFLLPLFLTPVYALLKVRMEDEWTSIVRPPTNTYVQHKKQYPAYLISPLVWLMYRECSGKKRKQQSKYSGEWWTKHPRIYTQKVSSTPKYKKVWFMRNATSVGKTLTTAHPQHADNFLLTQR